jgi:PPOX class probable F420-dependent enzyme
MELADARAVLTSQHRAVLATMRRDGTPQMSPVTIAVDDAGDAVVSSRQTAFKVRNLRRDPRVWVCVLPDAFFGKWIQVEGEATVVDHYRRVAGEHPDWAEYRAAMQSERRVLIRIRLTRAGPDRAG